MRFSYNENENFLFLKLENYQIYFLFSTYVFHKTITIPIQKNYLRDLLIDSED